MLVSAAKPTKVLIAHAAEVVDDAYPEAGGACVVHRYNVIENSRWCNADRCTPSDLSKEAPQPPD
jgi:hypothetical protein